LEIKDNLFSPIDLELKKATRELQTHLMIYYYYYYLRAYSRIRLHDVQWSYTYVASLLLNCAMGAALSSVHCVQWQTHKRLLRRSEEIRGGFFYDERSLPQLGYLATQVI